jgi:hypothetical protein
MNAPTEPTPAPENADPAFTEKYPEHLARQFIAGELMRALLKQWKSLDKPWSWLTEKEQGVALREIRDDVMATVRTATRLIVSDAQTNFKAEVDSVTFKDGVKVVLKMGRSDLSHLIADYTGTSILIVLDNGEQYLGLEDKIMETQPDQLGLPLDAAGAVTDTPPREGAPEAGGAEQPSVEPTAAGGSETAPAEAPAETPISPAEEALHLLSRLEVLPHNLVSPRDWAFIVAYSCAVRSLPVPKKDPTDEWVTEMHKLKVVASPEQLATKLDGLRKIEKRYRRELGGSPEAA